jgi:hypothetical protein
LDWVIGCGKGFSWFRLWLFLRIGLQNGDFGVLQEGQ